MITGCSSGIGLETARVLALTGATLYLTARDISKAKAALGDLAASDRVHLLQLDLNSLESVRVCAAAFHEKSSKLNVLIENAGVMMTPEGVTVDGFETQFGINYVAHFLLFQLLRPTLLASTAPSFHSRVITLSSIGHRSGEPEVDDLSSQSDYDPWVAYGKAKTANIWLAHQIEKLYGWQGLHGWAVQPGPAGTALYRYMSEEAVTAGASDPVLAKLFRTVEQGASTSIWAATANALEGQGGKYLEDCQISDEWKESDGPWSRGHSAWAYDDEKAAKLWTKTMDVVGLND